jgi:cyclopropane-fatty-acyl-phospholipid synthase
MTQLVDTLARHTALGLLARIRTGQVVVKDAGGEHHFGDRLEPEVTIRVHDGTTYRRWLSGSAGVGESYAEGRWDTDDLTALLRVIVRNLKPLEAAAARWHRLTKPVADPIRRLRRPDPDRDRTNVRTHYDLSNEFFAAFLDPTMTYSSAVFAHPGQDLQAAQEAKLDRLCRKLALGSHDHVVEIGTGWGSFALYAAQRYGCRVTTTTVSAAQHTEARRRVAEAGLGDRIDVRLEDYRHLTGTYDKAVSIEMIEAVDWRDLPGYFAALHRLVGDRGLVGLQAIVIGDDRYDRARVATDFIKAHVFPGGCLPSVGIITRTAAEAGPLDLVDLEDLGLHYAETLARWHHRLELIGDDLPGLGLDERFARLWSFYLRYCEAAFLERHVSVVQAVLAGRDWRAAGPSLRAV